MNGSRLWWIVAGVVSLSIHLVFAVILIFSVAPEPVAQQSLPQSKIELVAYKVERSKLNTSETSGQKVVQADRNEAQVSQNAIKQSRADALAVSSQIASLSDVRPERLNAIRQNPANLMVANIAPKPVFKTSRPLVTTALRTEEPTAVNIRSEVQAAIIFKAETPTVVSIGVKAPPTLSVASAPPNSASVRIKAAAALVLASSQTNTLVTRPAAAPPVTIVKTTVPSPIKSTPSNIPSADVHSSRLAERPSEPLQPEFDLATSVAAPDLADRLARSELPAEAQVASLAWSGANEDRFDPVSLAAIQSFMTEAELDNSGVNAGSVRDGIEGLLAEVPCSRLQVEFDPTSGTLELRGHIPDAGLRGPVTQALIAQIGDSIPVSDNLLILPRPQCDALSGIASVGLPQSTEQRSNPRLVGSDTHARRYQYKEGDYLILDMVAPEYDAYLYVDYYDADGNVIHLLPNNAVTLEKFSANSTVAIGAKRADGNFLEVIVTPPYGEEIATAFATSTPLYDNERPFSEPAAPYLDWLRLQVTNTRANTPEFKGEWVYFFVSTEKQ